MRPFALLLLVAVTCQACKEGDDAAPSDDAGSVQDAEITPDAAALRACEVEPPKECAEPKLHYADVAPIFSRRCTSCHNGTEDDGPWPLTSYQHVADWSGEIRAQMLVCTMPPPGSGIDMPVSERQKILSWIRCGFPK